MNTLNFTFNFHGSVGQSIAHVDKLEAHFDKDMSMQVVDTAAVCREGTEACPAVSETPSPWERDGERPQLLARAVEAVQSFFWAQSAWAVVYCVCRDHLGMADNMSEFERRVAGLPLERSVYGCPAGTVRKAFINNDYLRYATDRWPEGRARLLAGKLLEALRCDGRG